ncbi:Flowering time control FPA [Micractinium conductrix]|uniref:Flowering time control FPA n=1 Tax=Micractinium conductrix TaxID=554055 RepID=A0A2P6V217_9CHLO|nr:Flowering time control FPA [Micractinium conductrix]|eukprot:PSC68138.1 Flowering time control FPA [Micractinium conductrix]
MFALGVGGPTSDRWSAPVFVKVSGVEFGLVAGMDRAETLVGVLSDCALRSLIADGASFTMSSNWNFEITPLETDTTGGPNLSVMADVALQGTRITFDNHWNSKCYGTGVTPEQLLLGEIPAPPELTQMTDKLLAPDGGHHPATASLHVRRCAAATRRTLTWGPRRHRHGRMSVLPASGEPPLASRALLASAAAALCDSDPEVVARAGLTLGSELQLCPQCSSTTQDAALQAQLVSLAHAAVTAVQRHAGSTTVSAAAVQVLLRLSDCSLCGSQLSRDKQDELCAAGVVPAVVAALGTLCTMPAPPSAVAASTAAGSDGAEQQQPASQAPAISEGVQALQCMCAAHAGNLGQLAAAGGVQAVAAAISAASTEWPAEEQGLLLLAQLACREGATPAEQQAAAAAIWQSAQAQVERRLVEVGRAAVWAMSRVLQRLLPSSGAGAAGSSQHVAELLLQGTAVVLAMLQSCDKKDDSLMRHCLDFLAVAASAAAAQPAVAAALLSREAAAAVLVVAGQASGWHTQASALRALYHLCLAGGCGLTWQQLAAGAQPKAAELAAGAGAIAAAAFAVVAGAGSQAAAAPVKEAGPPARDALAVQLYGLAAVGALLAAVKARDGCAGALLAAQLQREQLAAAQDAVAAACSVLARSPDLLALLEQQPQEEEQGAPPVQLSLDSPRSSCHALAWKEPLAWQPAADAVRGVCALLRRAPEGLNTPDRDGFVLLHRLAAAGQTRCLQLLLVAAAASGGDGSAKGASGLDLLLRTRGGATALQLAKQQRHDGCVQLLEAATQAAAEARQAALLTELEEMEAEEAAKKGKKKKAVSRSISFTANQADERAQKLDGSHDADEEMLHAGSTAKAEAVAAARRWLEERLAAQREREEAYERALEARRQELAAQAAAVQVCAAPGVASRLPASSGGESAADENESQASSSSDGRDQPGTPDQQDEPAMPNAAAAAAAAAGAPLEHTSSGGSSSPEPQLPADEQLLAPQPPAASPFAADVAAAPAGTGGGLLQGVSFAGLTDAAVQAQAMLPSLDLLQQQASLSALTGSLARPGSAAGSLFEELTARGASSSLFGSPSFSCSLLDGTSSPHSSALPSPYYPSSAAGSPLLQTLAVGSPTAARPLSGHVSARGAASPPGSAAPHPSLANGAALPQPRAGLPPLPTGRQSALGGPTAGGPNADHLLSTHLADALFVGSPAPSPSSSLPAHHALSSPQQRQSLFAALAPAGCSGGGDADADSVHLLSSSLSCLEEASSRELLLSRHLSASGSGASSLGASASEAAMLAAAAAGMGLPPHSVLGSPGGGADSGSEGSQRMGDLNSDESLEPTRHLWIGNLGTRTPRTVLKGMFERFGIVDDVVTFPGRMYAFVNFRGTEEAMAATAALQDSIVPELTGDRHLLIKYRPAKKAAIHLRALGLVDEDGSPTEDRLDLDRDGNSSEPSPRIWLGNIAPTATSKSLHAVLGRFGPLTDAAVFPARIGPLGYAFVKFERLEDATRAFEALNNTVVPPLSGSKQLKMRYKPANDGPAVRSGDDPSDPGKAIMVPSRHLWLGNITQKPTDEQVLEVFASFGKVDSVRVFPVKAYAFVNYADIGSAIKAMQSVDGLAIPQLTGVKPLVMRYQQESGGSATSTPKPSSLLPRVASEAAMSAALGLNQLVPSASLVSLLASAGSASLAPAAPPPGAVDPSDDSLVPVANLSNKLNPNNIHYDAELAERYRHMSRREKDLMWAADSLLHPADPAKGMLRSHSMGSFLSQAPQSAAAAAAAATAQAHAAMTVLLQQQQHQAGGGASLGGGSAAASSGLLSSQLLALQQLAPGMAPPAQPSQVPTGASASQLTAVLNNLTAMRRSGSMPTPGHSLQLHSAQSAPLPPMHPGLTSPHSHGMQPALAPAHSLPMPCTHHQHHHHQQSHHQHHHQQDYLHQLLLQQQAAQQAGVHAATPPLSPMDSFGSGAAGASTAAAVAAAAAAASPSRQIQHLSSLLASQSLGGGGGGSRSATPLLSTGGHHGASALLSPQSPSGLPTQSIAAALGQLGAPSGSPAPPSPAGVSLAGHAHAPTTPSLAGAPLLGTGSLPSQFFCPLSRLIMTDPVLAADGMTYERHAISEWLAFKDVSPTTHMPLPHKLLTPNSVLRSSLIDILRQHC